MDQQPPQYPPSGPQPPYYQGSGPQPPQFPSSDSQPFPYQGPGSQPPQYPPSGSQPFPYQGSGPQPPYYQPMMPPPPPKKRNGWLIGIIVGVVVLLVACSVIGFFAFRAIGQTAANINSLATITVPAITPQATDQATSQTTPQGPSQSSQHHQVGETIAADATWTVTVHSVKTSQGTDIEKPDAGKTYLLIDVTVKNTSSQSQPSSSLLQFTLRDSSGQQINETIATFVPNAPNGNVEAGGQIRGTLVYQVPTGTNTYTLAFDPSLTSQTSVIWDIHVT
ncbi:MAG: DUF4352 domain-containing protein [Ktedonobacteraceae bacterium]|nr:DUF4352 domain-containing protein [Chloroflexota bacterium]